MGLGGILQRLKTEGVLVLYHDYRMGTLTDYSGTGNTAIITAPWTTKGVKCLTSAHNISVTENASLRLTVGTLILMADFNSFTATIEKRLISKRDAINGTNYDLRAVNTGITLFDGTNTRFLAVATNGSKCIAVNFSNGTIAEGFINGVSRGNFSGASAITATTSAFQICNSAINPLSFLDAIARATIIVNRKLTAAEHAELYYYLQRLA